MGVGKRYILNGAIEGDWKIYICRNQNHR